ncbi:alpha/beta fold hydrolase [Kitasatospora aureofaciens]
MTAAATESRWCCSTAGGRRRTCSATSTRHDLLDRIDVPTLVLGCEGGHVDPVSQRFIAERIPGARLHVFPASIAGSHFPALENPGEFNAVVEDFLS